MEDYSSIEKCKNPQDQQYDYLGALVVAKPKKKPSFRIVAIISIIVLAVVLCVIFAILATTSNL